MTIWYDSQARRRDPLLIHLQDLESREVWLYDDDPNLVEAMLRRIYQMPLTDDLLSQYRGLVDIEIALHQVASKYDVPCLAEESKERIQAWFAMMVGHENRRALGFYVHKLYHELKGNQRQLRNIARDVCDEHFESLLECKDLDFKQLLLDLPELAHDMGVDVQRMQMKTRMAGGDSTEQKDGESDDGWGDSLTFL